MPHFHASQNLSLTVQNEVVSIEHYLRQPHRLVQAITDPKRIQQLEPSVYHLELRPLEFMTVRFQPAADLKVDATADGTIHLESVRCEVIGVDFLQKSFNLRLKGYLSPNACGQATTLTGFAELDVDVTLPDSLQMFPNAMVEPAGNAFLNSILLTIKYRLQQQLVQDYRRWAAEHTSGNTLQPSSLNRTGTSPEVMAD